MKRQLKGSPSRDAFKKWHKFLLDYFYASDIDFVLVSKFPPGIVAVLDYKRPCDKITFAEVLAYNDLLGCGLAVYIIVGEESFEKLKIYQYSGGDWKPEPPEVKLELVLETKNRTDFLLWERELRNKYSVTRATREK